MAIKYNFCKLALLSSLFFNSILHAETPPPPPEEAINACASLNEGEQCSFTHPQGTLEGVCIKFEDNLACGPEGAFEPPIGAHFDVTSSTLFLPTVSVDDTLYFRVSLQLVSTAPILLNLTEATEITQANLVAATYDSNTEILLVPQFNYDSKQYKLELKLVDFKPSYQFELISMSEIN